jgi:hypothetical protein
MIAQVTDEALGILACGPALFLNGFRWLGSAGEPFINFAAAKQQLPPASAGAASGRALTACAHPVDAAPIRLTVVIEESQVLGQLVYVELLRLGCVLHGQSVRAGGSLFAGYPQFYDARVSFGKGARESMTSADSECRKGCPSYGQFDVA